MFIESLVRALVALRITDRLHSERGQSTAEYALILVAIAALVGVVISFLGGDGGGMISDLFGSVFGKLKSFVGLGS